MPKYFFSQTFTNFENVFLEYSSGICNFSAKQIISAQSDTLTNGFYIKEGIMQVNIGHEVGKEKTIAFIGAGAVFPIGVNEHRYKVEYSIVEKALTDVVAYRLPYLKLRQLVLDHPEIGMAMLEHYCEFTSFLFYEIGNQSYSNTHNKIYNCLYMFVQYGPYKDKVLPLNQDELANIAGTSRIQAARALHDLRKNGIVSTQRNKIKVLNETELKKLCLIE
jgi:CRP-like cAMP-binding protein